MAPRPPFTTAELNAFDAAYDTSREDSALRTRGEFLAAFPQNRLRDLTIDSYVIGHQSPTFCDYVEVKTRDWANIQGATAFKFGIYFGKTKSDRQKTYRFTNKFGNSKEGAFAAVKGALLDLVREGSKSDPGFAAIDDNPLSQLFKAKILNLYFPDRFLNVCSSEHLELMVAKVGLPDNLRLSEYQNRLLKTKCDNSTTRAWNNPKFMLFLYSTYIPKQRKVASLVERPRAKTHRKVNFEDIQDQREAIGRKAEEYALAWEKERLTGADLTHLIADIEDRRERPGYGYDFLSHSAVRRPRFIEVKSVAKLREGHRFFLSDNEYTVSSSPEHQDSYYFYLVSFDGGGEPTELRSIVASELYGHAEIAPSSYAVRFNIGHPSKKR
jgi:hypothetical protein